MAAEIQRGCSRSEMDGRAAAKRRKVKKRENTNENDGVSIDCSSANHG